MISNNEPTRPAATLHFEDDKVQCLRLDTLRATHKENDVYGNPLRGIYHYALIDKILEMAHAAGLHAELTDLFAAQNKDRQLPGVVLLPQVEQHYGPHAVQAHILRRVFATIRIRDLDTGELTTAVAVAYHQRGIQLGFGSHVLMCHNQCMLGADCYVTTYGQAGLTVDSALDRVKTWFEQFETRVLTERRLIDALRQREVTETEMFELIGRLQTLRVRSDTARREIKPVELYPLNQAQISRFTEDLLVQRFIKPSITAWDVYNAATACYKPTSMDIPKIMPQNLMMIDLLKDQLLP